MAKKRILYGCLRLESNSSTPYIVTERDFTVRRGEEMFENSPAIDYLTQQGYEVVPSFYAWAEPSGVMKLDTFINYVNELVSKVPVDGSIDGVYLSLHGAMQVEFINSGEAFLVSQVRERVGPAVPIAISHDFHASVSHTLCRLANIIVGFRTAPHTDTEETRVNAVKLLDRAVRENVLPWTKIIKVPIILPGEYCTTESDPAKYIVEQLSEIDKLPEVWRASYFTGMTWCDCAHNGNAIVVTGLGDWGGEVSDAMLKLAGEIWSRRHDFKMTTGTTMEPDKAIDEAYTHSGKLVFISDSGDNTTAGAIGDNAYMLGRLLEKHAGNALVAGIYDKDAAEACALAGEGAVLELSVGAYCDSKSTRLSLKNVTVKHIRRAHDGSVFSALVSVCGVDAIITASRTDFTCGQDMANCGAEWQKYSVIVVKLGYLFPELAEIADISIIAMTPGNSMLDVRGLEHINKRRPIFPLEDGFDYDPTKQMIY